MEELQDAIEDAQYVNAISSQEDGPRPVLAWDVATEEQMTQWKRNVMRDTTRGDVVPFGLDWTLSSAIGMFLFSSFLMDDCNDYLRINFAEEVIRWKKLRGRHRIEKAKDIISIYLQPLKKDETTGQVILPRKTEIDEYDLARPIPQIGTEDIELLCDANMDESNSESCIGLKGSVLMEIDNVMEGLEHKGENHQTLVGVAKDPDKKESACPETDNISYPVKDDTANDNDKDQNASNNPKLNALKKQLSALNIDRRQSRARKYLPDGLFDKAEAIVMESLRRQYWDAFTQSEKYKKMDNFHWYRDRRVVPEDFFILRVLGRGGFGLVTGERAITATCLFPSPHFLTNISIIACKKGTSGKLYAMKVMNKRRIKMKKSEQLALNERAALAAVESPFVVNLKYSFHSKDDVFLILDLMTGGDLGYHLHQKGRFPKKECLYYAARIMLGLQALHDHRFVYRDLKPENCLLADDGRVRITDLGLATKITPTLHGAAGTRGYWAPEMLRRDIKGKRMPYGHTVDWFSFGCCLAEFISGQNPFRSQAALKFGVSKGQQGKVSIVQ